MSDKDDNVPDAEGKPAITIRNWDTIDTMLGQWMRLKKIIDAAPHGLVEHYKRVNPDFATLVDDVLQTHRAMVGGQPSA